MTIASVYVKFHKLVLSFSRAMKLVEVNSAHGSIPRDSEISRLLQQMMKEFEV